MRNTQVMTKIIDFLLLLCIYALAVTAADTEWWKSNPNIYQISPLSFKDSNGDGRGDIRGIISKLDYFVETGIDVLMLSPFYRTSHVDFGYDITNHIDVDPVFGTMNDIEELIAKAKEKGLRIIFDFVPNHTSIDHEWFKKSENKEGNFTDFYVWHDGLATINYGRPMHPNLWISEYGGFSWKWSTKREAYYYHKFAEEQPELDLTENRVILELNKILEFWLDKGVDGFRIDAVSELFEDPAYVNNPDKRINLPATYELIEKWRKLLDDYSTAKETDAKILIPQIWNSPLPELMAYYESDDKTPRAQVPMNFMLINELTEISSASDFKQVIDKYLKALPEGAVGNWFLGTHDHNRVASRMGKERIDGLMILLQTLPGISFTYNGDEIGMDDYTEISWEDTQDIMACNAYVDSYREISRDFARTPFQWDSSVSAGFSTSTFTWLPLNPSYTFINLDAQMNAERSHYKLFKELLQLRKNTLFIYGDFDSKVLGSNVFTYARTYGGVSFVIAINFGGANENVDVLSNFNNLYLNEVSKIHLTSSNSNYTVGDIVNITSLGLQPYDAVIISYSSASKMSLSIISAVLILVKLFC